METRFLTQPDKSFAKIFKEHLSNYETVRIATAYLTENGIKEIEKELLTKRSVKILCGVHGCISDLSALKNLISQSKKKIEGGVFLGANVFHPKLYIFENNNSAVLLVGSSNLTGSGLHSNEEAIIEVIGTALSQPIVDAIKYFEGLWNTNSVSVEKYLNEHPRYFVRQNQNESLTSDQKNRLQSIKEEQISTNTITFENQVNTTLLNHGKQTVHTKFNSIIDSLNLCKLHKSVYFDIILPNSLSVPGQMYYGPNNTGVYYQLKISGSENTKKLRNQISINDILEYKIDLSRKIIYINLA